MLDGSSTPAPRPWATAAAAACSTADANGLLPGNVTVPDAAAAAAAGPGAAGDAFKVLGVWGGEVPKELGGAKISSTAAASSSDRLSTSSSFSLSCPCWPPSPTPASGPVAPAPVAGSTPGVTGTTVDTAAAPLAAAGAAAPLQRSASKPRVAVREAMGLRGPEGEETGEGVVGDAPPTLASPCRDSVLRALPLLGPPQGGATARSMGMGAEAVRLGAPAGSAAASVGGGEEAVGTNLLSAAPAATVAAAVAAVATRGLERRCDCARATSRMSWSSAGKGTWSHATHKFSCACVFIKAECLKAWEPKEQTYEVADGPVESKQAHRS